MSTNDDKYIILPSGGDDGKAQKPEELGEIPSLEQYVFATSVVQTALIQLLVEKNLISMEDLTAQVEKVRSGM